MRTAHIDRCPDRTTKFSTKLLLRTVDSYISHCTLHRERSSLDRSSRLYLEKDLSLMPMSEHTNLVCSIHKALGVKCWVGPGKEKPPGRGVKAPKSQESVVWQDFCHKNILQSLIAWRGLILILSDEVLALEKFPLESLLSGLKCFDSWGDSFISNYKFCLCYMLAKHLRNELPKRPDTMGASSPFIFSGKVGQFLKRRCASRQQKSSVHFFTNVFQAKRATAVVDDTFIRQTFLDHKKTLSTPEVVEEKHLEIQKGYFDLFWSRLIPKPAPIVDRLFCARDCYSTNACSEHFRREGGQHELLRLYTEWIDEVSHPEMYSTDAMKSVNSAIDEICHRATYDNSISQDVLLDCAATVAPLDVLSLRRSHSYLLAFDSLVLMDHKRQDGKVFEVRGKYTTDFGTLRRVASLLSSSDSKACVAAICEPLKVRTITKMPGFQSAIAKNLQKLMHTALRQNSVFSCLDRPIDSEMMESFLERCKWNDRSETFVSGDYKGATDSVKISYTKACFESLLRHLRVPDDLAMIYRSVLYECEISYPERFEIPSFTQKSGQLMGSVLSFPILCVLNFCAWWSSETEYLMKHSNLKDEFEAASFLLDFWSAGGRFLDSCPCLVNGDDILFATNQEHYENWERSIKEYGFILSMGKNYVSDKFLMINSRPFWKPTMEFLDFYNVGLLTGSSKVMERIDCKGDNEIDMEYGLLCKRAVSLRAVWNSVSQASSQPAISWLQFLLTFKDELDIISDHGRINPFIPELLGGLGFRSEGIQYYTTRQQRRLARICYASLKKGIEPKFLSVYKTENSGIRPLQYSLEEELYFLVSEDEVPSVRPILKRQVAGITPSLLDFGVDLKFTCHRELFSSLQRGDYALRDIPSFENIMEYFPRKKFVKGIRTAPLGVL